MVKVANDVPQSLLDTFNVIDYKRTQNKDALIGKLRSVVNLPFIGLKTRREPPFGNASGKIVAFDVPQSLLDVANSVAWEMYTEQEIKKINAQVQSLLLEQQGIVWKS